MGGGMSRAEHDRLMQEAIWEMRDQMEESMREANEVRAQEEKARHASDEAACQEAERRRKEYEKRENDLKEEMNRVKQQFQALVDAEEARKKAEEELRNYPIAEWMFPYVKGVNVGIVGSSGTGKSLLNNKLRGLKFKKDNPDLWAETGETETTLYPQPFKSPEYDNVHLWDLPGVGTKRFPQQTYFRDVGLKHFQSLIIVCRNRFTQGELNLRDECQRLGLPVFFVRTHMDTAVASEEEDNGLSIEETMDKVRTYMRDQAGVMDPFLLALRGKPEQTFEDEKKRLIAALDSAIMRFLPHTRVHGI